MLGIWGHHAGAFLATAGALIVVAFGVPMALWPLGWARALRWDLPERTDLAVYFGRCLGCVAIVVGAFALYSATQPAVQPFYFRFFLATGILITAAHVWGAVKGIQPATETYEIAFWLALVILTLAFWPSG